MRTASRSGSSRNRTRALPSAVAAAAASALIGCVAIGSKQSASTSTSQVVDAVSSLRVVNRNGSVTVIEDSTVTGAVVSAEIRCFADSVEEAERRVRAAALVAERGAGGETRVRVDFPEPTTSQDSARIEIRTAGATRLDLETSNGRISVTGLGGALTAKTSNGAIEIDGHDGTLGLESSNGRIVVKGATASVHAKTSNGAIDISFAGSAAGAAAADVRADTSNGAIDIALPASWSGTITGTTSNGRVLLQAPGSDGAAREVSANRTATTSVGDGRAKADASTSNGRVSVTVGGR